MVGSGVPDEVPTELTREGVLRAARKRQRNLFMTLGDRLGINSLSDRASSSDLVTGGSVREARRQQLLKGLRGASSEGELNE